MNIKKNIEPSNTTNSLRIMMTLINIDTPLSLSDIARKSGMSRQLVNYYLTKLVSNGLVVVYQDKENILYTVQEFLNDDIVYKKLIDYLDPIINLIAKNIICPPDLSIEEKQLYIQNNLAMWLKTIELTI